jgi:16S rRNA (guanine527-N7)-methyltransferase
MHGQKTVKRNRAQLLREGLERLGIEWKAADEQRLALYLREIEKWNPRFNLVKAHGEELIVKHLLDSLVALPVLLKMEPRDRIADVGSGAGLPGIPLALFMPESSFFLIERSSRKADFLRNMVALLKLKNTRVLEYDLAKIAAQPKVATMCAESFDIVLFRAFAKLSDSQMELIHRMTGTNGTIVAYKGRLTQIRKELAVVGERYGDVSIVPVNVPFLSRERHLVLIRRRESSR